MPETTSLRGRNGEERRVDSAERDEETKVLGKDFCLFMCADHLIQTVFKACAADNCLKPPPFTPCSFPSSSPAVPQNSPTFIAVGIHPFHSPLTDHSYRTHFQQFVSDTVTTERPDPSPVCDMAAPSVTSRERRPAGTAASQVSSSLDSWLIPLGARGGVRHLWHLLACADGLSGNLSSLLERRVTASRRPRRQGGARFNSDPRPPQISMEVPGGVWGFHDGNMVRICGEASILPIGK
ncbi:hypothetical protein B0H17DRAFT_1184173 [Mycena rosella]|uniref:Uncharacterized protein n=1 Tax=Mycena rosella TaxID=1033263 RepID=A0AAD7CY22_MYCRO|nr:hypothetical protein B0H17DRAFT_1184173 [Mycena rosella]